MNNLLFSDWLKNKKQAADELCEEKWEDRDAALGWTMNYTGTEHYIERYCVEYHWHGASLAGPILRATKYAQTACGQRFGFGRKREYRSRCMRCEAMNQATK